MSSHFDATSAGIHATVIGSWPKPAYLFNGLPSHSGDGKGQASTWNKDATEETRDRATREAIQDQVECGLRFISDGEQRRDNYIFYHIRCGFTNVDFENRSEHIQRGGHERSMAPTIVGKIGVKETGFLVNDYLKAKADLPDGATMVVTMPGPMTVIDTIHDAFYHDEEALAEDIVAVLRQEAELLVEAGVEYISVDEPVYVRYPDKVEKWGIRMLDKLIRGLDCFKAVHICCSYPTCPQKADCTLYQDIVGQLAASHLDAVSIEYANREFDLESVVKPLGDAGKAVILGVCRVHEDVESVELIKERARKALKYIKPWQMMLGPDCGLVCISREATMAKLKSLVQATNELNQELDYDLKLRLEAQQN